MEQRIKAILGEQLFTIAALQVELDAARTKITELERTVRETAPEPDKPSDT